MNSTVHFNITIYNSHVKLSRFSLTIFPAIFQTNTFQVGRINSSLQTVIICSEHGYFSFIFAPAYVRTLFYFSWYIGGTLHTIPQCCISFNCFDSWLFTFCHDNHFLSVFSRQIPTPTQSNDVLCSQVLWWNDNSVLTIHPHWRCDENSHLCLGQAPMAWKQTLMVPWGDLSKT